MNSSARYNLRLATIYLIAAVCGVLPVRGGSAADVYWMSDANVGWTSSFWSPYSPGSEDDVIIDRPGSYTITLSGLGSSRTIHSLTCAEGLKLSAALTINADSLISGSLEITSGGAYISKGNAAINGSLVQAGHFATDGISTINGNYSWNSGSISGTGVLRLAPTATTTINSYATRSLSGTLENAGLINLADFYSIDLSGGTFTNLESGTVNITNSSTSRIGLYGNETSAVNNRGLMKVLDGPIYIASPFTNSGTVNVAISSFELDTATNTGVINVSSGATLTSTGNIQNTGTINYSSSGSYPIRIQGVGALNILGGTATGTVGDGTVSISGGATLQASINTAATISGAGALELMADAGAFTGSIQTTGPVRVLSTSLFNIDTDQNILGAFLLNAYRSNRGFGGSGNVTLNGPVSWINGTMAGTGKTTLANTSTTTISPAVVEDTVIISRVVENAGTVTYNTNRVIAFNGGRFDNLLGGTFTVSSTDFIGGGFAAWTGAEKFNNSGVFNKTGNNTFTTSVPINNLGTLNVSAGTLAMGTTQLTNSGIIQVASGALLTTAPAKPILNSGTINYSSTGTYSVAVDNSGTVNILKGNATGLAKNGQINVSSGATLFSDGSAATVHVDAGGTFGVGGISSSIISGPGSVSLSAFPSSTFTGSILVTGSVGLYAQGTVNINADQLISGPFTLNAGNSAAGIFGTGNITLANSFLWLRGRMAGTGKTTLLAGATATLGSGPNPTNEIVLGRRFDNAGTMNLSQVLTLAVDQLNNLPGGIINLPTNTYMSLTSATSQGAFYNAGTINKTAGGTDHFSLPLINSGTLNVSAPATSTTSSLTLDGGGSNTGVINVSAGARLQFADLNNAGVVNYSGVTGEVVAPQTHLIPSFTNSAAGVFNVLAGSVYYRGANHGQINVSPGATLLLSGSVFAAGGKTSGAGNVAFNANVPELAGQLLHTGTTTFGAILTLTADQQLSGAVNLAGDIGGPANLTIGGPFSWVTGKMSGSGTTTLPSTAQTTLPTVGGNRRLARELNNAGAFTLASNASIVFKNGTFNNLAGATLTATGAGSFDGFNPEFVNNVFRNFGTLSKTGSSNFHVSVPVENTGTINVAGGSLVLARGFSHTGRLILNNSFLSFGSAFPVVIANGSIEGSGSIFLGSPTIASSLTTGGLLTPGPAAGQLTFRYGPVALQETARLAIELGATQPVSGYDVLNATGGITVGGKLLVSLIEQFQSSILPTDTFAVVVSGTDPILGQFSNAASGQRFLSSDGVGTFIAHYGAGSAYDPSQVVLTDFLPLLPGDLDFDSDVDGADFVAWQTHFPLANGASMSDGDADGDGDVDGADFVIWQTNFPYPALQAAAVPEPPTACLAILSIFALCGFKICRGT